MDGVYTFDLINPNGTSLYGVQYQEASKSCPWCWLVAPALGVISEVIEALDDTVTEDCVEQAQQVCGANGVQSVTTAEPTDGGIFGNDTPGSCEIICND